MKNIWSSENPYGYLTIQHGRTVVKVIKSLRTRQQELDNPSFRAWKVLEEYDGLIQVLMVSPDSYKLKQIHKDILYARLVREYGDVEFPF
jgi:hypothetical protein